MIIAWVASLLVLLSALVGQFERLVQLETINVNTFAEAQQHFIAAEKSILECEQQLANIANLEHIPCHIQSAGKNLWLISSQEKPRVEIIVFLNDKTHVATRLNWRQNFE